jgi:hypothetical protein
MKNSTNYKIKGTQTKYDLSKLNDIKKMLDAVLEIARDKGFSSS